MTSTIDPTPKEVPGGNSKFIMGIEEEVGENLPGISKNGEGPTISFSIEFMLSYMCSFPAISEKFY